MTTPAQGNLPGSASKRPDAAFEASGLSPDEAERLAAAFRPSWEFDEAPFAHAGAHGAQPLDHAQLDDLNAHDFRESLDARTVAPHAPPPRMETSEPEVSVIIDRSITAAEMEAQRAPVSARPPAPAVPSPFAVQAASVTASPSFVPAPAQSRRVAPVLRRGADDSLELPASLKKSNKGLFIGLGVAVAAAALVLSVHGLMSSSSEAAPSQPTTNAEAPAATVPPPEATHAAPAIPPPPPPAPPPPPVVTAAPAASPPIPAPVPVSSLPVATQPQRTVTAAPKPAPHPTPAPVVHHPAPRNPPKPAGGGIVRDNPF